MWGRVIATIIVHRSFLPLDVVQWEYSVPLQVICDRSERKRQSDVVEHMSCSTATHTRITQHAFICMRVCQSCDECGPSARARPLSLDVGCYLLLAACLMPHASYYLRRLGSAKPL
jgi:hypothetical protein